MSISWKITSILLIVIPTTYADEPVPQRAISGDAAEPKWEQTLTVTVGPAKADLVGSDHKAIQAAIDYVAGLGGGTVHVLPGTYRLRNSVFLRSKVRLLGSGPETVLFKEPSKSTKLKENSDWYDREITLEDPAGFSVGDGVCLIAMSPQKTKTVLLRTLVARSGNRFKLDRALRQNVWLKGDATATTVFPLLCGDNVADIAIENLVLDGNRKYNANLDGNYGGCVFLQDCNRITLRKVTARHNNGDGISWQICHDVLVEDCTSHGHAGLGLHPGSGSQRPIMRGNKLRDNDIGIFFCWGVRGGLAEKNLIEDNRVGVSIGHRDTDNTVKDNDILRSGKIGVLFRAEDGPAFAPHRNKILDNRIIDSGSVGIDIHGVADGLVITGNKIAETRTAKNRIGLRIEKTAGSVQLRDNPMEGYETPIVDLRK